MFLGGTRALRFSVFYTSRRKLGDLTKRNIHVMCVVAYLRWLAFGSRIYTRSLTKHFTVHKYTWDAGAKEYLRVGGNGIEFHLL